MTIPLHRQLAAVRDEISEMRDSLSLPLRGGVDLVIERRAYWDNPRYVSRFFSAADHGGMGGARASALEAKPEVEREAALRRRSMR